MEEARTGGRPCFNFLFPFKTIWKVLWPKTEQNFNIQQFKKKLAKRRRQATVSSSFFCLKLEAAAIGKLLPCGIATRRRRRRCTPVKTCRTVTLLVFSRPGLSAQLLLLPGILIVTWTLQSKHYEFKMFFLATFVIKLFTFKCTVVGRLFSQRQLFTKV